MLLSLTKNVVSHWPSSAVYGAAGGVLVVGLFVGVLFNRWRGHRAIAQRLMALASRLGVEPRDDKGKVESALSFLEEATGAAATAVAARHQRLGLLVAKDHPARLVAEHQTKGECVE